MSQTLSISPRSLWPPNDASPSKPSKPSKPEDIEGVTEWVNSLIREEDDEPLIVRQQKRKNVLQLLIPYILLGVATIPVTMYFYGWFNSILTISSTFWKLTLCIGSMVLGASAIIFGFVLIWLFYAMIKSIIKGI